jgi:hypothetical protein
VTQVFANSQKATDIELITSFYREFVDPSGLDLLLSMRATVYIYTGSHFFHPKVYLFHGSPSVAIIGSSNFTLGGFRNNLELNVLTDEPGFVGTVQAFVDRLKSDPVVGILTPEALSKYTDIESGKKTFTGNLPVYNPPLEDQSELHKYLNFLNQPPPQASKTIARVLKMRLSAKGQHSRDLWDVVWLTERKNIVYGESYKFFPPADQEFEVQFSFSGHEFTPIRTHITSSKQISGLPNKLRSAGFRLKPGDILCFEQVEPGKLYRFWLEQEASNGQSPQKRGV